MTRQTMTRVVATRDESGSVRSLSSHYGVYTVGLSPYHATALYHTWRWSHRTTWIGKDGVLRERWGSPQGWQTHVINDSTWEWMGRYPKNPYYKAILENFDEPKSMDEMCSLREHFESREHIRHMGLYRFLLNCPDTGELTRRMFGKTRYRKDLVKAVSMASTSSLLLAHEFRGLVPVDWIVAFLNRDHGSIADQSMTTIRPHLRSLDQRSLRRLLAHPLTTRDWRLIGDMARMRTNPDLTRVDSWSDFHDKVVRYDRRVRAAIIESEREKNAARDAILLRIERERRALANADWVRC